MASWQCPSMHLQPVRKITGWMGGCPGNIGSVDAREYDQNPRARKIITMSDTDSQHLAVLRPVALWQALHLHVDVPPHVLEDETRSLWRYWPARRITWNKPQQSPAPRGSLWIYRARFVIEDMKSSGRPCGATRPAESELLGLGQRQLRYQGSYRRKVLVFLLQRLAALRGQLRLAKLFGQ